MIKGIKEDDAKWIKAARGNGYTDVESLWRRAGIAPSHLAHLAEGDAFADIGLNRRDALWQAKALQGPKPLPLFGFDGEGQVEPEIALAKMTLGQEVIDDYRALRLSLRAHPLEILRPQLPESLAANQLSTKSGRIMTTGLVVTRQRPGTASGVIFVTLEDETGSTNVIIWAKTYEMYRAAVLGGRLLRITGRLQHEGQISHLLAEQIEDISHLLAAMGKGPISAVEQSRASDKLAAAREGLASHPREQAKKLFPSRDFH